MTIPKYTSAGSSLVGLPLIFGWVFACVIAMPMADGRAQESLADVIERAEKSVVRIEVSGVDGESLGSGFVVDTEGTLVTNCHVLAGAQRAIVHFTNGLSCPIVGTYSIDEQRDIVVAKIGIRTAPPIEIANSTPRKGETVTALGSPHGLSFTATNGIVSAIRPASEMKSDLGRESIQGTWIQVDAALSPGNSGGPLIDQQGRVVGMSTLASSGTVAQNLNFGISATDIREAVRKASGSRTTPLANGVGRVKMRESSSPTDGLAAAVPQKAIDAYLKTGRENYPALMRGLRQEAARLTSDLREMRTGQTFIPPNVRVAGASTVRVNLPGMRTPKWFFQSQDVKEAAVEKQQLRIREYNKLKNQVRSVDDAESIFKLLWNYGPELDARNTESVGFITDLIAVHAFNDHDVLAVYEDAPYLVWMESTAGISRGEILSGPVYVVGTSTAQLESGLTASVTLLREVSDSALRSAVDRHFAAANRGSANPDGPGDQYRTWHDRTGKFSVEALLLSSEGDQAVLKKKDGSIVRVPLSALSEADQKYINQ